MELHEAFKELGKAGLICEWSATGLDEFIEDLSNCCGFVSGDEIVFSKMPGSAYWVRLMNHNQTLANIEYDYDKGKIVVFIKGMNSGANYTEELDKDVPVEKVKEIGKRIHDIAEHRAHNHL
jgi:hypothetical protein